MEITIIFKVFSFAKAIFSLAPLLIIAIAIAGTVFDREVAQNQIIEQIQGLIGIQGAQAVRAMIQNAQQPGSGEILATVFGIATLLLGASGVFGQLQEALNTIWVFFSAQILLLGAEFTQVYARRHGSLTSQPK